MLTVQAKTAYDILCSIAGDTEVYKIIEAEEVLEQLPEGLKLTKLQLSGIIRDLKDREYIDVKYFTPDEYCLQIVRRVEIPASQQGEKQTPPVGETRERQLYGEKKQKTESKPATVKKGFVFWMAFLGAFLGSGIVATAAMLIIKFVL